MGDCYFSSTSYHLKNRKCGDIMFTFLGIDKRVTMHLFVPFPVLERFVQSGQEVQVV